MDIELLLPERIAAWNDLLELPAGAVQALQEMAVTVCADPLLLEIFTQFHTQTALEGKWHTDWSPLLMDERVKERFQARASLFYLLAYLAALPYTEKRYLELGVSREILKDTLRDVQFYTCDYHDLHGEWGYGVFSWIWLHLSCKLFRLGRLQFRHMPFPGGVTAFRGRADGRVLLLADPETPLRGDGNAWGSFKEEKNEDGSWKPAFEPLPHGWRGHPVSPYGFALPQPVDLSSQEWELILQMDDPVLDIHIPRRDPLNRETCSASLQQAAEFFPQVFGVQAKAFWCHTWFFTPQLQKLLSPESTIVQFQREFYLYPNAGGLDFLWSFAFGERYPERATAPRDTSLRRAVLDWLEAGGEIFDLPGVRFHPPGEWGSQPYMTEWDKKG
jgi:hypothetical protein